MREKVTHKRVEFPQHDLIHGTTLIAKANHLVVCDIVCQQILFLPRKLKAIDSVGCIYFTNYKYVFK